MRLDQLTFYPASGALLAADGSVIELKRRAQGVFNCLAEADGEFVSKDMLLDAVWPDVIVSEDSLYQAVAELRRALGNADLIETVPREGYRLRTGDAVRRPVRLRWIFGVAGMALGALVVTFVERVAGHGL